LCDGDTAVALAERRTTSAWAMATRAQTRAAWARIHRRPILDQAMQDRVMAEIVMPTIKGMKMEGLPDSGVLFVGLMIDARTGRAWWNTMSASAIRNAR